MRLVLARGLVAALFFLVDLRGFGEVTAASSVTCGVAVSMADATGAMATSLGADTASWVETGVTSTMLVVSETGDASTGAGSTGADSVTIDVPTTEVGENDPIGAEGAIETAADLPFGRAE